MGKLYSWSIFCCYNKIPEARYFIKKRVSVSPVLEAKTPRLCSCICLALGRAFWLYHNLVDDLMSGHMQDRNKRDAGVSLLFFIITYSFRELTRVIRDLH
jgi:hypothetical protein